MHRSMASYVMSPADLITAVMMVVLITLIWVLAVPAVCELWVHMMDYGIHHLPFHGQLHITEHHITSFLRFRVPFPSMEPILPDAQVWRITGLVTLAIFVGTFFLPAQWIPVTYLLRGILFVQATALVYFALIPAEFPHTPDSYLEGLLASGLAHDLHHAPAVRPYIFYLSIQHAAKSIADIDDHGAPGPVFAPANSASGNHPAKDCPFYAGPIHRLRNAFGCPDHHRLLRLGHDLEFPCFRGPRRRPIVPSPENPALVRISAHFLRENPALHSERE